MVVVRRNQVMFLLYDETIIGAEFDDPDLRLQAAYPGFAIMQSAAYMDRKFEKAAQIGLGIGTVPSFLRHMQIPTGAFVSCVLIYLCVCVFDATTNHSLVCMGNP